MRRYVVRTEFYVWAESDSDAINQAKEITRSQDQEKDDRCDVVKIVEQPFGSLTNREVVL